MITKTFGLESQKSYFGHVGRGAKNFFDINIYLLKSDHLVFCEAKYWFLEWGRRTAGMYQYAHPGHVACQTSENFNTLMSFATLAAMNRDFDTIEGLQRLLKDPELAKVSQCEEMAGLFHTPLGRHVVSLVRDMKDAQLAEFTLSKEECAKAVDGLGSVRAHQS